MITIQIRHPEFAGLQSRERFAKFLAITVDGDDNSPVYRLVNATNPYQFGIGRGNDWWVTFSEDGKSFSISHRYQCDRVKAEEALSGWLLFRLSGATLKENSGG